jgi:GNAT superfamily N-acetyltransferase
LVFEQRRYDDPELAGLVAAVHAFYVELYGSPDDEDMAVEPFLPPHGRFLVGRVDDEIAVTGGWRRLPDGRAEIKRMFVLEHVRRGGLARQMLAELERTARLDGVDTMVLCTGFRQLAAMAMYESAGYERVDGFGHYRDQPGAFFYGKRLPGGAATAEVRPGRTDGAEVSG